MARVLLVGWLMGVDRNAPTEAPSLATDLAYEPLAAFRVERTDDTAPPPASGSLRPTPVAGLSNEPRTDVPSARPTSIPDVLPSALSSGGSWLGERPHVLADIVVPVRIAAGPAQTDLRAAFILAHVDGVSTIAEIAVTAALPLPEVIACFMRFVELGVVELCGDGPTDAPSASGVFPCFTEDDVGFWKTG